MKTSKLFIAAISAIVLFASCTKENNGAIEKAGSVSITLSAGMTDASDTKANLGDKTGTSYPMCWEAEGETVAAVITDAEGTKTTVVSEKEYTVSQDSKTADFKFICSLAEDSKYYSAYSTESINTNFYSHEKAPFLWYTEIVLKERGNY